jgi:pyruvate formate lyase activating enzyme
MPAAKAHERGRIHSFEVGSTVDGPGVRMVVWTSGCPLRCQYCHNPDTWRARSGRLMECDELTGELARYARFLSAAGGGLTVSGGEPLAQAPFVMNLFRAAKQLGVHTALDTSGFMGERLSDADLEAIDMVLLDIKSFDPATHRRVTGVEIEPVLRFARRLADAGRPTWVRFVLVPGLTDDPDNIAGLADFVAPLPNVERVEVLPFHQMGRYKWAELGLTYQLADTPPPDAEQLEAARAHFRARGLRTT